MATIIEIQDSKFEHLSECAEQIVRHGKKLMQCLADLEEGKSDYSERYGRRRRTDDDYLRYY